jgi:hypothetical protein
MFEFIVCKKIYYYFSSVDMHAVAAQYNIILILHLSWLFIDSHNLPSISFTLGTTRQQWSFAKIINNTVAGAVYVLTIG